MSVKLARIQDRARQYYLLTRLDRPIGILLLLWPTLWALWIAGDGGLNNNTGGVSAPSGTPHSQRDFKDDHGT